MARHSLKLTGSPLYFRAFFNVRPHVISGARHKVPFDIGKPQLRPPWCDTRVTPEEKRRLFFARRAQETEQRRALFNAEADAEGT